MLEASTLGEELMRADLQAALSTMSGHLVTQLGSGGCARLLLNALMEEGFITRRRIGNAYLYSPAAGRE